MSMEGKNIFAKLGEIITAKGMQKNELAAKLGVTNVTLSRWISGNITPTYEHLADICRELDVTATDILGF